MVKKRLMQTFKPHRSGLGRVLGDIEKVVMDVIWNKNEATGREIFEEVGRDKQLAFTTVLTVMDRLLKKGLIKRVKHDRLFVYTATMSRDDFVRQVSHEVLEGIFEISSGSAASSFVEILYKTNPEEIESLTRLIEEKKRLSNV
ncbi:MAG: BlaI/MecI/CopY family transcriptional regulator [Nitrospira sp.]|nr:BlaI/MecI/CopY family transcriptional regulator [Nitrospira sp.]